MHRGIDLNSEPVQPMLPQLLRRRRADEFWQIDLCTTDGLSSCKGFSTLCQTLPWRLQTQDVFLLGSVPLHGLRPANLSREFARHRSLPARATHQALPSRHSRPSLALVQVTPRFRLLCHSCQKALRFPATLLTASGPSYGGDLRSDCYARQSCPPPRLSREAASHSLCRCANESTTRLSNQQLQLVTSDYRPTVSQPLAGRVVLQMDQATPAHQKFLRHFRERLAHSNLDCHLGLCARGHSQKGIAPGGQSLQNVTDLQRHSFRENPHFTGSFFSRRSNQLRRSMQTTDSVQLTLGQY